MNKIFFWALFVILVFFMNSCHVGHKCQHPAELGNIRVDCISIDYPSCIELITDPQYEDHFFISFKYENEIILTVALAWDVEYWIKPKENDIVEVRNGLEFIYSYDHNAKGNADKVVQVRLMSPKKMEGPLDIYYVYKTVDPEKILIADKIVKSTTYIPKEIPKTDSESQ